MLSANEKDFYSHLSVLEAEMEIIAETGDTFRGERTASSWLVDMLCLIQLITNKEKPSPQLEKMAFRLIAYYPGLYGNSDPQDQSFKQMCRVYNTLVRSRDFFVNSCHTLTKVECQQMAKDRAGRSADKPTRITEDETSYFYSNFWKHPLENDHSFFQDISNYALRFKQDTVKFLDKDGNHSDTAKERDWCKDIKGMFLRVAYYPVTSMLMPVLLTKYIVDDMEYDSVYTYMKYRKSSFPRNHSVDRYKENIQLLYDAVVRRVDQLDDEWVAHVGTWYESEIQKHMQKIHDTTAEEENKPLFVRERAKAALKIPIPDVLQAMDEMYREHQKTAFRRGLPVISFPLILSILQGKFAENQYSFDGAKLWEQLDKYTQRNGLSFLESRKKHVNTEQIVISIALLCNAESYLNYKCGTVPNKAVRAALDYLNDKHIIEKPSVEFKSEDARYLSMYEEF